MTFTHTPRQNYILTKSSHVQGEPAVILRDFRQPRELELLVNGPTPIHKAFLSSVTSIELRKVVFAVWHTHAWGTLEVGMGIWTSIDEQLCGLVDRLRATGYRHTLEVELRPKKPGNDPGEYDPTIFLPKFREKGIVTVLRASS